MKRNNSTFSSISLPALLKASVLKIHPAIPLVVFLSVFFSGSLCAQDTRSIRFRKTQDLIYFFQKTQSSDSLVQGKNDLFYLLVPDTLKPFVSITVENAQLILQDNDSLVLCKHLPGIRYEHYYQRDMEQKLTYKVGVNGAAVVGAEEVVIDFTDKRTGLVIFTNRFRYRPN